MTNEELLVAMSNMMDQKLGSTVSDMVDQKLKATMSDMMDQKLDEKLEPLKKDMSEVKDRVTNIETRMTKIENRVTNMETQITNIKDRVTNIEIDIENDIRPGIITLCDAYGTQFDRYSISIESHEKMKTDIEVMKSIVSRHFDLLPEERRAIGQ